MHLLVFFSVSFSKSTHVWYNEKLGSDYMLYAQVKKETNKNRKQRRRKQGSSVFMLTFLLCSCFCMLSSFFLHMLYNVFVCVFYFFFNIKKKQVITCAIMILKAAHAYHNVCYTFNDDELHRNRHFPSDSAATNSYFQYGTLFITINMFLNPKKFLFFYLWMCFISISHYNWNQTQQQRKIKCSDSNFHFKTSSFSVIIIILKLHQSLAGESSANFVALANSNDWLKWWMFL